MDETESINWNLSPYATEIFKIDGCYDPHSENVSICEFCSFESDGRWFLRAYGEENGNIDRLAFEELIHRQ